MSSNHPMQHERKDSLGSLYFLLLKRELFESSHIMVLDLKGAFSVIMSLNHTNKSTVVNYESTSFMRKMALLFHTNLSHAGDFS